MTAVSEDELAGEIVTAIESVAGLHPDVPPGVALAEWVPRLGPRSAVDVSPEVVEIRVTASALPLPPLLDKLAAAVRELLAATRWAGARLRIVVTDLDADVFDTAVT
ncbi:hypothetical protein [Nocardia africana]|uniref:Asp23/Gls24 family envelope stress response protein n=1 Tax=Nocardia africana TaxID=134964 RepID=A0A378WQ93_9NOCA|nr:hypothetical protein [Nocardia africana]MCC3315200.1 hypothetical protein [Nocardia africana]SUA42503.1 Uncharacterised protein [Nocardia africana]